eukprot:1139829-Pelagomonas_calceolata.AAC.3
MSEARSRALVCAALLFGLGNGGLFAMSAGSAIASSRRLLGWEYSHAEPSGPTYIIFPSQESSNGGSSLIKSFPMIQKSRLQASHMRLR